MGGVVVTVAALGAVLAQGQGDNPITFSVPHCEGHCTLMPWELEPLKSETVEGHLEFRCQTSCTVEQSIRAAAALYGVAYSRLSCLVRRESTNNPTATNGPYAGLTQFDAQTWSLTPYREFSRFNGWANVHAAAYLLSRGGGSRWPVWARGEC